MCGSQQTGKFLKRWEYQTTVPASWETCMQVKKQQLEPNTEQRIDSKLRKEYIRVVHYHSLYLFNLYAEYIIRYSWLDDSQTGIKIAGRNINNLRWYHSNGRKQRELKSLLVRVKQESEKVGLKFNILKTKIMTSSPITSWQIGGKKSGDSNRFYFLGLQNHSMMWL